MLLPEVSAISYACDVADFIEQSSMSGLFGFIYFDSNGDDIQGLVYSPPGQPYNVAPWNYFGTEGEIFDSNGELEFGDTGYPETVVDWVLVSIRTAPNAIPLCRAAALLHSDGHIEFVEEFTCCTLNPLIDYYFVVEHRSHLIVMSNTPVEVTNDGKINYDFRGQDSYSTSPSSVSQKLIGTNETGEVYAMYGGNGQQSNSGAADTDINLNDLSFWSLVNGSISSYHIADYNINGDVNLNDRVIFNINNGSFTSVPRDQ